MLKVEGSSPFIRSSEPAGNGEFLSWIEERELEGVAREMPRISLEDALKLVRLCRLRRGDGSRCR